MGLRRPVVKRGFPRYREVKENFPGRFESEDNGTELSIKVLDVSRDGLGILVDEWLEAGNTVKMHLNDREILFSVVYCNPDLIYPDRYRCGLHRYGSQENLVNLFAAVDCLK